MKFPISTESAPSKYLSYFLEYGSFYVVLTGCLLIFWFVLARDFEQTTGQDANAFCLAGRAIRNGRNPFLIQELNFANSWNYLPIYAYGFRFLCSRFGFEDTYVFIYAFLLMVSLDQWVDGRSWLFGVVLGLTGVYSFGWNLVTGNIGVIELLFLSIATLTLRRSKNLAFFLLGLVASVKVVTILYALLFLYSIKDEGRKLVPVMWGVCGFILPFAISTILFFDLMPWYFRQLFGLIPRQPGAILETADFFSPSITNLLIRFLLVGSPGWLGFLVGLILFALAIYAAWRLVNLLNEQMTETDDKWWTAVGVLLFIITLFLPRLKPYSLLPALIGIYLFTMSMRKWIQSLVLFFISIVPMGAYYAYRNNLVFLSFPHLDDGIIHVVNFVLEFNQPIFLLIVFGCVTFYEGKSRSKKNLTGNVPLPKVRSV